MSSQFHSGATLSPCLRPRLLGLGFCLLLLTASPARAQYPAGHQLTKDGTTVLLEDYATAPLSSRTVFSYSPTNINFSDQLSRINFIRPEPTNAPGFGARYFVCDLNRNLYIVNKTNPLATNNWTPYINFEETFPRFDNDPGFAGGLVTFQFDPEYASNGIFYTVHMETTNLPVRAPTNGALPGFNTNGYTTTATVTPPSGSFQRLAVIVEWTDTNIANPTFEGTARELLRIGFFGTIHPIGDLLFNPLAPPGHPDYRNLYLAVGDGRAGEISGTTHSHPQRLDALVGKVLRITPDLSLRTNDLLGANGRYRIPSTGPDPNPFTSTNAAFTNLTNLKPEIYAYGFRNCHRFSWDVPSGLLLLNDIGFHAWEEVNIIHKGRNYGYAEREGIEQVFITNGLNNGLTGSQNGTPFPTNDVLNVSGFIAPVTPTYPVACYSHKDGDAISSGFVYRGQLMPQLYGKYIFGDITTARLLYCDLNEMIAADDGILLTTAPIHEIQVAFNSPYDNPDQGVTNRRFFNVIADAYRARGGTSLAVMPGAADNTSANDPYGVPYGGGRADIRFGIGDDNELYIISKTDGMIRKMVGVLSPFIIQSATLTSNITTLTWQSVSNRSYRVQFKTSLDETNWTDLPGDVTATGSTASKTDTAPATNHFYHVVLLP